MSRKKKNPITLVGITVTGKPIIGGLFKMHDTIGFPLSLSFAQCYHHGWTPSVPCFAADATIAGWDSPKIERTLEEALRFCGLLGDWNGIMKLGVSMACRHAKRFCTTAQAALVSGEHARRN